MSSLSIYAGPTALQQIRREGLKADQFKVLVGASGGPKWFVLYGLDRYLFGEFFPRREQQLITLGSSAGAWRLCCLAISDPVSAIERLARLYSRQKYSDQPTAAEISEKARAMLSEVLGSDGARQIVENQYFRTHIITSRVRGLGASSFAALQVLALLASAACNLVSRKTLSLFFERTLFSNMGQTSPWTALSDLATVVHKLSVENLEEVMIASGSIPFALEGVRDISGAEPGLYWDGGITDYHFDMPFHAGRELVLYPHFSAAVIPGWFDKKLPWRRANPRHFHNVVLVTPSREFVADLSYGKIPDRSDFQNLDYDSRLAYWQEVLDKSKLIADEFAHIVDTGNGIDNILRFGDKPR